jgi:hypothetical protein
MKKLLSILAFVCFMSMIAETAVAQPGQLITFDENGIGTFMGQPLNWSMFPDPGPGGLGSALTYLPSFGSDFPGDLLIEEPTGNLSDVVRFNPLNAITGPSIVFYSDRVENTFEKPDLADVGLPTAFYTNTISMMEQGTEDNNWVDYTPLPGQPGYLPNYPGTTYHIISDVPEPSTFILLGMGVFTLAFYGWRRRRI